MIKNKPTINSSIFLLMSWVSGGLELGCIIFGISHNLSIYQIVGLGLAYQIGNLVPNPLNISKNNMIFIALINIVIFLYLIFYDNYCLLFIAFAFISATIQYLRSSQKSLVSTGVKRTFRIIGFISAPFFSIKPILLCSILLFIVCLTTKFRHKQQFSKDYSLISIIMIVHQIHYFSYVYFILYALSTFAHSIFLLCIYFCLGWISYTSVPYLLKKVGYYKCFILGHTFLFLNLLLMSYALNNEFLTVLLWVLTGFGGGTVFCIEKIYSSNKDHTTSDLTFSENIGHILGVIVGLGIFYITNSINYVILLGGGSAFIAMLLMLLQKYILQEKQI